MRTAAVAVLALAVLTACSAGGCSWFSGKKPRKEERATPAAPKPAACPFCGTVPEDPLLIQRRPIGIKIENDPAARPQSGLDRACIVYEEECEGGVTRFLAIYLDKNVESLGPVRSARPADVDIAFPFNPLFCHCGGAPPTISMVKASGIPDLDEMSWPGAYWRSGSRRAPHNLYSSTTRLRQAGEATYPYQGTPAAPFVYLSDDEQARMESDRSRQIRKDLAKQARPDPDYVPAFTVVTNVHIPYDPICVVDYRYDSSTGRFLRFVQGRPHTELTTGQQLNADTVIVQYVTTTPSGIVDVNKADTPNLGILGAGRAQVFVRGRVIEADWSKPARDVHTSFTDSAGRAVRIKPGITWVELVPTGMSVTFN